LKTRLQKIAILANFYPQQNDQFVSFNDLNLGRQINRFMFAKYQTESIVSLPSDCETLQSFKNLWINL